MMKFTYDKDANAAYIYLSEISVGSVKKTVPTNDNIILDFDTNKQLVGIEILDARSILSSEALLEASQPQNT